MGTSSPGAPHGRPLALHVAFGVLGWVVIGLIVLAVAMAFLGSFLVRRGIRQPFFVRLVNRTSDRILERVKRPITIAVLDEVADVLRSGHYTRNIASALEENRLELTQMVLEKVKQDPTTGRVSMIPFHERIIVEASQATLRVILEILGDPRTDELVSDLLRDNITQIKQAVRDQHGSPPPFRPAGVPPPTGGTQVPGQPGG